MAAAGTAIGIDCLPDGVMQLVFSHLPLPERLRLGSVCRQWHAVSLAPALLARVAIQASGQHGGWHQKLRNACAWLVRRAAGSVQHLSIEVDGVYFSRAAEEEAAALIENTLAAAGSSLRRAALVLGVDVSLHLGAWATALTSLQRLSVSGRDCTINVSGDLRGLTALRALKLWNSDVEFSPAARLPPSLTSLSLEMQESYAPIPLQLAKLTRLRKLYLCSQCDSRDYRPLRALSSTLHSLCLYNCPRLPKCLPRMLALRTLIITEDTPLASAFGDHQGAHNAHVLKKTLRKLPSLQHLTVEPWDPVPPSVMLPPGPWQHTVRRLVASADLLHASLPALGGATRLQKLGIGRACMQDQQPALQVLRWVAEEQPAPLRCLSVRYPDDCLPCPAVYDAVDLVQRRHPEIEARFELEGYS